MKTRNPNATCGNCPWISKHEECRRVMWGRIPQYMNATGNWSEPGYFGFVDPKEPACPDHPDFWQDSAPEETVPLIDPSNTLDAHVWAKAFCQRFGGDEMLMLSWFANAIERGRDAGRGETDREQQLRAALERLVRLVEPRMSVLRGSYEVSLGGYREIVTALNAAKEALHD